MPIHVSTKSEEAGMWNSELDTNLTHMGRLQMPVAESAVCINNNNHGYYRCHCHRRSDRYVYDPWVNLDPLTWMWLCQFYCQNPSNHRYILMFFDASLLSFQTTVVALLFFTLIVCRYIEIKHLTGAMISVNVW